MNIYMSNYNMKVTLIRESNKNAQAVCLFPKVCLCFCYAAESMHLLYRSVFHSKFHIALFGQ